MPYEEDKLQYSVDVVKKTPQPKPQVINFVKGDEQFRKEGMGIEQARIFYIKEKEIKIKKLQNKFAHKHQCGIIYYSGKELTKEEEKSIESKCQCKHIPSNHYLAVCDLGHGNVVPTNVRFKQNKCRECNKMMNTPTPEEAELTQQSMQANKKRMDFAKKVEEGKKQYEIHLKSKVEAEKAKLIAQAVAQTLKPLFEDLKEHMKK